MTPWTDRSGKFSPLKAAVLLGLCLPALVLAWRAASGTLAPAIAAGPLGPRPITEAIHFTGDWAIRFLFLSLAVTPLRRIAQWPKLIAVRRMVGLAALFYALGHLLLYAMDQKWLLATIASEIALRIYLTIGFAALVGLAVLGSTSTDAAIRRLGKNWNRLHRLVYAIAILAALHFFMQSKADVFEPTLMAGWFVLLMAYRLAHARGWQVGSPFVLAAIAVLGGLVTAGLEVAWYASATGVPPGRVLAANLQFAFSIRPAWWILATGIAVAVLAAVRPLFGRREPGRGSGGRLGRAERAAVAGR